MVIIISVLVLFLLVSATAGRFPPEFSFGAAVSALQTEGAWLKDGKSFTIWDNLARIPRYVEDNGTTENTCNSYHMYDRDIAILREYGIKHYRMSIQWARVMPRGKAGSRVNPKAVAFYRGMLTALRRAGIEPYVNLYHNDMPTGLYFGGYNRSDEDFPKHFVYYADQCFRLFGDLVKYWFTFDEPWCQSVQCRYEPQELNTRPYKFGYYMLLAHAEAVKIYRAKYQPTQGGKIGFNLNGEMFWPKNPNSEADKKAAERNIWFQIGWFWQPIMTGDYPEVMKQRVGKRLPKFTPEQSEMLKGAADFFALNHYNSWMVADGGSVNQTSYDDDVNSTNTYKPEWKVSDINFSIVPEGMHDLLMFIHNTWLKGTNIPIFITENGVSVSESNIADAVNDTKRIDFMMGYMSNMEKAIAEGANVQKYFTWSLLDNFEWGHGFTSHFGLTRVEYKDGYKRIPKASLKWYSEVIKEYSTMP